MAASRETSMFKLLIVGATGLVGGEALKLALQDKRVSHVVAISRRPIPSHPKLENHVVDFNALPEDAAWWNVDAAICALGTTKRKTKSSKEYHKIDVEYPVSIAKIVRTKGAKSFAVVSSTGASLHSPSSYLRMKGEVENELSKIGFFSLTIVRPSFISGIRQETRPMENAFSSLFNLIDPIIPKRWRAVSGHRIAQALLESVIEPKAGVVIRESETL